MSVAVVMEGIMSARAASARIAAAKNPNKYNFVITPERVVSCSVFCCRVNRNFFLCGFHRCTTHCMGWRFWNSCLNVKARMNDESGRRRHFYRASKRRRRIFGIAFIALLLAALLALRPAYHWLKTKRADSLAAKAERFVQEENFLDAANTYRAALQLDPLGYNPLQGAARLATRLNHDEALGLWDQVVRLPQATSDDREERAAVLLQAGKFPAAALAIDELLKQNPDTNALVLASRYSERTGNSAKALEYARIAMKRAPQDEIAQARLAEVLAASLKADERAEAREILWAVAAKHGAARKSAIESLACAPDLTRDEQTKILDLLHTLDHVP